MQYLQLDLRFLTMNVSSSTELWAYINALRPEFGPGFRYVLKRLPLQLPEFPRRKENKHGGMFSRIAIVCPNAKLGCRCPAALLNTVFKRHNKFNLVMSPFAQKHISHLWNSTIEIQIV